MSIYVVSNKLRSKKLTPGEKSKIIESIHKHRSVDDVITYLLANVKGTKLTADDEVLHSAFFELKKTHQKLLKSLVFSCGDIFPYSNELQESIFGLQSSGLMEAPNPVYEFYRISRQAKHLISESLSEVFPPSEKRELEQMGDELSKLLSRKVE